MNLQILTVPYDSARRNAGMGAGPEHWLTRGLDSRLTAANHTLHHTPIEDPDPSPAEIKTAFALNRALSREVAAAKANHRFPLVLAGNCNTALGTLSGAGMAATGVIWFDAHGDFNSPDTSESGFFDGMGLNIAAGRSWHRLAASIPGFTPIPGSHIIHVGGRAFDLDERETLEAGGAAVVDSPAIRRDGINALIPALDALASQVQQVYLHLDLDVLDPDLGLQANRFPEPDGLTIDHVSEAIRAIKAHFSLAALAITAYDPTYDNQDRVLNAGFTLIDTALE